MGCVRNILETKGNAVFTIDADASVYEALEKLVSKNIGALLVTDNDRFAGIFTERDYARKVILMGKASKETPIREIMTEKVITVTPDTTIQECMHIMTSKYIRHLPVLRDGQLIGLISIGDVVKYTIEEQKFIIENLEHYITGI